jgi:hypothetical protein
MRSPKIQNGTPARRMADTPGLPGGGRDARLDMFRGLALVMIFINHVPGTVYENFTSRNFGFSDAAEAFVFMSGMAAGLAYSGRFDTAPVWPAIARVWARARQLYFVHLVITLISLGIFAFAAQQFGIVEALSKNNIPPLFQNPLGAMIGLPLLTHQLGYLNILPLYAVLLVATPGLILIGRRWPKRLLVGAILVWMMAGTFRLNFPNYPTSGGWFFNPLSWQLIFVVGLLAGMAMKRGERLVPKRPALVAAAAAITLFILLWVKLDWLGAAGREVLGFLSRMGLPFYITWFDKTFLALPRLGHALVLFYLLSSLGFVAQFAQSRMAAPLRLLGRNGLAVFATGTVLSMALQAVKLAVPRDPLTDGMMLGGGLLLLYGMAYALSRTAELSRSPRAARTSTTTPSIEGGTR